MQRSGAGGSVDRIAILGAGAWGTALAQHLACHGVPVALWARRAELAEQLLATRTNPLLPGVLLAATVSISHRLEEVLDGAELVLLAAPSHTAREVLVRAAPHWPSRATLVSAAKGIENHTLLTTGEVATQVLGERLGRRIVVLSGPSFAAEVAAGQPTSLVAAALDVQHAERVQRELSIGRLR
ncbi:MAG: 2-dehydropantoate 2-reductase N-terminal domain-containing protein, partial [Deltaproteobacteria bacterium]